MTAPVRIEAKAWSDLRFATLARILGLVDSDHALIKVARLWSWQTENFTPERPTYVIDEDAIVSVLGPDGPAALVRSRLATAVAGGYRMHGTEGQIEWRGDLSSTRQQAGRARVAGARRDARGRLLPREQEYDSPAETPAADQQPTSSRPAESSALTLIPEDQNLSPARAIPSSTEPAPPNRGDAELARRQEIRRALWSDLEAARAAVGAELRLAVQPLLAMDPGEQALALRLLQAKGGDELERIAKQTRHAIAVAAQEAKVAKSLQWLTGVIFEEKNFRRLVAATLEEARRPPRAPKGDPPAAPTPRKPDPPPLPAVIAPANLAGPADFAAARELLGIEARAGPASRSLRDHDQQPEPEAAT